VYIEGNPVVVENNPLKVWMPEEKKRSKKTDYFAMLVK
jgi:hypothetical protein